MNVLILTPDAVGSTLLQRLITIYMQFHDFDRPVINLHELTNGLEKYYSPEFNREIVSKRRVQSWSYYQSLDEIVSILDSVDHYKTSRLAHYHIRNRQDPIEKQIPFYRYLDQNFFVIACRRHNIFEHALSMSINTITKKLNVYSHDEKIRTFIDMYADKIKIDERVFVSKLEAYRDYIEWSQNYFTAASYFYYDEHIENLERYILDLPIFNGQKNCITWKQQFNIEFNDWNRFHHVPSDLGSVSSEKLTSIRNAQRVLPDRLEIYQQTAPEDWPAVYTDSDIDKLPADIVSNFTDMARQIMLAPSDKKIKMFLDQNNKGYDSACQAISRMQELDIILSPPPIKKQTFQEKMRIINNFDRCLKIYNQWISRYPELGNILTDQDIESQNQREDAFWKDFRIASDSGSGALPMSRLGCQNDDDL
jgi:hypothetical protein